MSKPTATPFDPRAEWESAQPSLCGVWVAPDGEAWLATAENDGPRVTTQTQFHPFTGSKVSIGRARCQSGALFLAPGAM